MSRIYVDRISPYQSGSVQVDGLSIDTGSLVTTASFNAYTSSNDSVVNALVSATSSYQPAGDYATTGSNTFTGKQTVNNYVEQNFDAPSANNEYGFANISNASVSGKSYGRVFNGFADYSNFGDPAYEDYFSIEYYDGFGYNFGSEFDVNGKQTNLSTKASGSGQLSYIRTTDNYDGTSQVTISSANKVVVSGSFQSNSNLTQTFVAPGTGVEKAFVNVTGAQISGKSYDRVYFGIADYPGYGQEFEDYFGIEYYDGFGYNSASYAGALTRYVCHYRTFAA